jgi:Flp pilus assembly protein TadG
MHKSSATRKPGTRKENGQVLILVALAFIGLLAIIGLAVDAGALFIGMGHLRRGVDSAALAAAAQFREGRNINDLTASAQEFFQLNQGVPTVTAVTVETCATTPSLCPTGKKKYVRVTAQAEVQFSFLPVIGISKMTISSSAVAEAASLDVVLVIDTSDSMAYETNWNGGTCKYDADGNPRSYDDLNLCINQCNGSNSCQPFKDVKNAAKSFINDLNTPYDRVAVVDFSQQTILDLKLQSDKNVAKTAIDNLKVSDALTPGVGTCTWTEMGDDPSGCTNTSIGGGLMAAASAFTDPVGGINAVHEESLWVAILLTDGAANASIPNPADPSIVNIYCPPTTWDDLPNTPFCRDASADTRHSLLRGSSYGYDPGLYDADDFARDMADLVGCSADAADAAPLCHDSLSYGTNQGGQGALIFTIGLGEDNMIKNPYGDPQAGEKLLRYAANVGYDGNPDPSTDQCKNIAPGHSCGNYYFSPTSSELSGIFEDIASRIFTRLTQ